MTDSERSGAFDHLLAEPVRRSVDESGYGAWRTIADADAVPLAFGFPFPSSFPADELASATAAVLDAEGGSALQYGGGEYSDGLVDTVVERATAKGIDCDDEEVTLVNGAIHGLDTVCRTFLEPGDEVFVEAPTFMGSLRVFRANGAEITGIPLDDGGMDVEHVEDVLRARREQGREPPKFVYTIPNFQNPTGTTLTRRRRCRLLELADEYDFLVVADDAYGELRYDGDAVPPLKALDGSDRVVRIGTFSKTIAPGVRTGWVVAHGEISEQVARMAAGGTNTFTRSVLGRYCAEGRLEAAVAELRRAYERRRDRMLEGLDAHLPPGATWTEPDGGFFVWVELPDGIDTASLLPEAVEQGVTYLPGPMFYPDDGGTNALRLSFSQAPVEEIPDGIEALGRAIESPASGRS